MDSMSVIRDHTKVGQGINTNHADLTVAQQSPEGRDRGGSKEETYEEKDEVKVLHLHHLFDQTAKTMSASGQRVGAGAGAGAGIAMKDL
jgi:hypothetical protein